MHKGEKIVMKVGYLGPAATFTHLAVSSCFQNGAEHVAYRTIPECNEKVEPLFLLLASEPFFLQFLKLSVIFHFLERFIEFVCQFTVLSESNC